MNIASFMADSTALVKPALVRARTRDGFQTFDTATRDSTGAFLIGELERLDQKLHEPLAAVTWSRDIALRSDVSMADEVSSFTNSSFAAAGGTAPAGKSWIGKDSNAITSMALDIGKTANPLLLWGQEVSFTIPELASAEKMGRPIDVQKYNALKLKHQMDIDEMVYTGDSTLGLYGLFNNDGVITHANVVAAGASSPTGNTTSLKWVDKTADAILNDVNTLLAATWAAAGWAVMPENLRLPPVQFGYLVSQKISSAGNMSILQFLRENNLLTASTGRKLDIQPVKWLTGRGASNTDRMVAYTNDEDRVRFPMVPLQRTPVEYRSLYQITTYYGRLGVVEFVYPETVQYADGI